MLSFGKWLCCLSCRQVYEYITSAKKFCNCLFLLRIEVLNPRCQAYTRNGFNSCGVSSQFSVTFSECAKFGNKIIQIICVGKQGNQSGPLPGFLVVTSLDSIITQCLQMSLSRDLARGGGGWNSGYSKHGCSEAGCHSWVSKVITRLWSKKHYEEPKGS